MHFSNSILFGLTLSPLVRAHMFMNSPPTFKFSMNPHTVSPDRNLTSPLSAYGSNYPCKGYHKLLGTPEGAPVVTWAAGSIRAASVEGDANYNGGSCQISLSIDGGKTFRVIKSFIGGCPHSDTPFAFYIPKEIPSNTTALFAWTWFNTRSNKEMYMNCAAVSIVNGTGGDLSDLPDTFKANIGNGCTTTAGTDVIFPNPGKDTSNNSLFPAPPQGTCQKSVPEGETPSTNRSSLVKPSNSSSPTASFSSNTYSANMTRTIVKTRYFLTQVVTQLITIASTASPSPLLKVNATSTSTYIVTVWPSNITSSALGTAPSNTSASGILIKPIMPSGTSQVTKNTTQTTPSSTLTKTTVVTLSIPSTTSKPTVATSTTPSATPKSTTSIKPATSSSIVVKSSSLTPTTLVKSTSFAAFPKPHQSDPPKAPSSSSKKSSHRIVTSSFYNPFPYPNRHNGNPP